MHKKILEVLGNYNRHIFHASFIGSNYKVQDQKLYKNSDIDVLVILNNMDSYYPILNDLEYAFKSTPNLLIVNGWGVVSQDYLKKDIIHLLIDPDWNINKRKFLFQNSINYYPIQIGQPLVDFNLSEVNKEEFLSYGPYRMLDKLINNDWGIERWNKDDNVWHLIKETNKYSDSNGFIFYCCIHSIMNTLRYLNVSSIFNGYVKILHTWKSLNAPEYSYVEKIMDLKYNQQPYVELDKEEASDFLRKLCNWIDKY